MKTLFDEVSLGKLRIRNRLARSATWEAMADEGGHISKGLTAMYTALAEGGTGLIFTGATYVTPDSCALPGQVGLYSDELVAEARMFTERMHRTGAKIILQATCTAKNGVALTPENADPAALVAAFAEGARRAQAAGYDGIQIHAAHGVTLGQFLNPSTNPRTDAYGGNAENRMRIILEVYQAVRKNVTKDFAVLIKLNSVEPPNPEEAFATCKSLCLKLDEMGIDGIEISGGMDVEKYSESQYRDYAAEIAAAVRATVLLVGKNRSLQTMEELLNTTNIGMFSICKALICQPDLAHYWQNDPTAPPKCVFCGQCMDENGLSCAFSR